MKSTVTCLLIVSLVVPASARERTPLEQAKKIALGSRVVVTLKDKQIRAGYLSEIAQDRLTLGVSFQGDWSGELLFQDVESVRQYKARWTIKEILLIPVFLVWGFGYLLCCGGFGGEI
jgi:hypothetical protein